MKFEFSNILYGGLLSPSYIIRQLTGSVFDTGLKWSKQLFKRFCWTLPYLTFIILFKIFLHPKDSGGFKYQCKKAKYEDFLD